MTKPLQRLLLYTSDRPIRASAQIVFAGDEYFRANPDVSNSGLLSAVDYFLFGASEGRDPHPLFNARYYLECNPDVRDSAQNPLLHYLRHGAAEGRDPHWLFNTNYYLSRYPDVRKSFNPLLHYIAVGQYEHRQTSLSFDPEFYHGTQVDTFRAGALTHYQQYGFREGRSPSVDFDPSYYLQIHSDVARAEFEPFMHYVRFGKAEGRRIRTPRMESSDPRAYLPIERAFPVAGSPPTTDRIVNVVVPVYRGFRETRACLESVFVAVNRLRTVVTVINDLTPEPELAAYLRDVSARNNVKLIEHQSNAGFVASVNEGMSLYPDCDVVLLNSDTEVFGNWVDRLSAHAYSCRAASVTPFSNNATICSYPKFCENNIIPNELSAVDLDRSISVANAGRHCAIPTAVGFCMYIRRDALNDVGVFDEATFGKGYGEENDFCMRAIYRGWSHLLAADTFVYHAGSVSFGSSTEPQELAMQALLSKHPRYMDHVRWHFQMNPANAYRIAATLYRMLLSSRPVRLTVSHNLGGGTLEHIRKLQRLTHDQITWLNLAPAGDENIRLSCDRHGFEFSLVLDPLHEHSLLLELLRYLRLQRIHVHHLLGFPLDIKGLIRDSGIPYDVTLHDYYFVCPRVNFTREEGRYCGEGQCRCRDVSTNGNGHLDLFSWRAASGAFLAGAARIIAPSADTTERFRRYFPWLKIIPAWHDHYAATVTPSDVGESQPLKIAVLGVMALHKGFVNLRDCLKLAAESHAPVEFVLIGGCDSSIEGDLLELVRTGPYKSEELCQLLKRHAPHLVWFPCQWPETFSYTLSTCLELGFPVAVPNLGAFAERLDGRKWSWILPWDTTPRQWLDFFVRIRREHFRKKVSPPSPQTVRTIDSGFYPDKFLRSHAEVGVRDVRTKSNHTVLALPSIFANGQVQPCGYVRIVQPLTHPIIGDGLNFYAVDIEAALHTQADALIIQRTAVTSLEHATRLINHCRKFGIRLIYEIDDDLFRLPMEHPEHAHYAAITKAAKLLARAADTVTVSTETLQRMLLRYNENVHLIPNYIDERLWLPSNLTPRQPSRLVRALYMGTSSHKPDLAIIEEPVRRLQEKFAFELNVIGVSDDPGPSAWFHCTPVPDHLGVSYPNFVKWLNSVGPWDFGLAPLHESRFNIHKSGIKAFEYAAMGLPTVASAVVPYVDVVEDSRTGLLVRNTTLEWYESLGLLCESTLLRERLANEVHSRQRQWTLASNAEYLRKTWHAALFGSGGGLAACSSASALEQAHEVS